jgi:hypothetical protein
MTRAQAKKWRALAEKHRRELRFASLPKWARDFLEETLGALREAEDFAETQGKDILQLQAELNRGGS